MKDSFELKTNAELGTDNPGFVIDNDFSHRNPEEKVKSHDKPAAKSISSDNDAEEEGPDRQQWSNGVEFLMSCIAMSVGLGNIWRFPFTAFENGGGAFLIPYIIVLFVIGKPMYYMEMAMGQFSSYGPIKVWNINPLFKGIGYGQMFATACTLTYYCSLMALTSFYFVMSFSAELPWARCKPEWQPNCFDSVKTENSTFNFSASLQSSSELYFVRHVLREVDSIRDGLGAPDWRLALCLLFSWLCVFGVVIRGVKSSGKAAYFLALFPYVIMTALLIKGCTLEGAGRGVLFFITPQWEQLLNPRVWYAAVTQAFFSLNVGFGSLIMYSSYNNFKENIHRDALIVTTLDTFTSLMAGCTIFAILGNLAHEMGIDDIRQVVRGGTGLAFISYPDAIAKFPAVPQLFAVLFFLMLFVLGVGSAVALASSVITIVCDQFPHFRYWLVVCSVCTGGFLIGLVYVTPGGQYILNLVDFYAVTFVVFVLAAFEMIGVHWIYGLNNFCHDLEFMQGHPVGVYWRLCWGLITPVILFVVLVYFIATMEPLTYTNGYIYPDSAYAAGWVLLGFGVLQFPLWLTIRLIKKRHIGFPKVVVQAARATERWCPKIASHRREWLAFRADKKTEASSIAEVETVLQKLLRKFLGIVTIRARTHHEH
ncbi:sodium-dependent nutrient amino acid transporter 1-like isoform X2 [Bacillus rossius redtenbacheri]|uniref:sodium-dependent nutrient amino acid transporter 1-like isoform X2 n=1 Tax=Bacillus rossius redtenbacheri TaxID=93214 RepID=UPI002FDD78CA